MSMRVALAIVTLCAGMTLAACAPRTAITTWPWSDWYRRGGGGEMGAFKHQRDACLAEAGITDPGAVATDSATEDAYIRCMNAAGWCTTAFNCEKSGAS